MTPTRWLITGGCGFIGRNLIARLHEEVPDAHIRVLDNLSVGSRDDLSEVSSFREIAASASLYGHSLPAPPGSVDLVVGDIRDFSTCYCCCSNIDIVVHLAANTGVAPSVNDPRYDMEANVIGTFNALEAARRQGTGKFIFASSGAPLGDVIPPIHEEKAPRPVSPYGASKLAGEAYCSAYYRTYRLNTVSLRFGNVYGPLSTHKNSVVAKFIRQALAGETLEIFGDGSQTRDFIYIADLVHAIMLSAKADVGGEVFQIATHTETTVNEIASKIHDIAPKFTDREIRIIHGSSRLGDVRRNFSDISKARSLLGFEPAFDLDRGLGLTFDYFCREPLLEQEVV